MPTTGSEKNLNSTLGIEKHTELFELVFNGVHSMIAYMDRDFRFILVNRSYAEANGKSPDYFVGKNHFDLFPRPENEAAFKRVVETGEPHRVLGKPFGTTSQKKQKQSFFDWSLEPVKDASKEIVGVVLTLVDVTDRRRAEDALRLSEETKEKIESDRERVEHDRFRLAAVIEQADEGTLEKQLRQSQKMEALGTLAGGIAHDLNNILMPIIMNAEMIEEDLEEGNPLRHFAQKVLTSAHRGRDLVRGILTFSREKDEEHRVFSIVQPIKEALDLVSPTLPPTVVLKQCIAADVGQMKGDPAQIQEVIVNLCANSAHAIGDSRGTIEVTLENAHLDEDSNPEHSDLKPGSYVKLSVRDTGKGMDDSFQERIFEPFFTTKKTSEGIGMGLAMVHGAVRRHKGAIYVDSARGKGTTFSIYFPRAMETIVAKEELRDAPRGSGEHVLIVDDEQEIVEAARNVLGRLGYQVIAESRADRALEILREDTRRFDLAVLDFALAEMTGIELAKRISAIRPGLPMILTTGFSGAIDPVEIESAGIREVMTKPLTSREMGEAIKRVLDV
jgi:PAS domain S-box-containing protein